MLARITFVGQDGQKYGCLENVDETQTLSHVRKSGYRFLNNILPEAYTFTWKNTPISPQQEEILKVSRCSKVVSQQPRALELSINVKCQGNSSSSERSRVTCNSVPDISQSESGNVFVGNENESSNLRSGLELFHENEIQDPKIPTMEKERRIFWNLLASNICSQSQFRGWSLQAVNGLIDTEWTLRKTELLKIDADQEIKNIRTQNAESEKTDKRESKIERILQKLLLLDVQRKNVYKKIEGLHAQLKHITTDRTSFQEQIALEEDNLDKVIIELKSCQSSLEQSIASSLNRTEYTGVDDSAKTSNQTEARSEVLLSDDEFEEVRQSVVEDYAVDNVTDMN